MWLKTNLRRVLNDEVLGCRWRADRQHVLVEPRPSTATQSYQEVSVVDEQPLNLVTRHHPVVPRLTLQRRTRCFLTRRSNKSAEVKNCSWSTDWQDGPVCWMAATRLCFSPPQNCPPSCRPLWIDTHDGDTHPTNIIISQWWDEWKSASVVNSSQVDDPTIGFNPSICYWALLNHFRTKQDYCASCWKHWRLAATNVCPCGKCQTMSHIVNSCPQTKMGR